MYTIWGGGGGRTKHRYRLHFDEITFHFRQSTIKSLAQQPLVLHEFSAISSLII